MSDLLRNALQYAAEDQAQRAADREAAAAQDMWAPTRSYHATRIGTDINANNIDEAAARTNGRIQEADALAQRTAALQQRQAMYAPDVERVEDIGSKNGYLRDGLSWFGTQVGSGVGSMQDPAAVAAAGTALGRVPGLRGIAPLAGMAGAYMLNQRQMAGEHYGRLKEDPQALRNLGDQGAYQQSNLVGVAGGALDTLLPGMAGRALGGAALRGAGGMIGRNVGTKIVGGMAMEGATEVGQGEIGRLAHSYANAGRDTSGDWSDRLNEAAGGAAGGSPFSAAGALADRAYGQTARVGEVVREKAGEVRDLTREQAGMAAEKGKQAYEDSGIKGVIDLGLEKGRSVFESAGEVGKAVQDYMRDAQGKINYPETIAKAQRDYENFKMSQQEADLLQNTSAPPDLPPEQMQAWADQNYQARGEYVMQKLEALEQAGVQEASAILDAMASDDRVVQTQAIDDASAFLLERNKAAQLGRRNALFQAHLAKFIQGGARRVTQGAKAAGNAAAFTGLNAAEGVRQGLSGKKNMQGTGELQMLDYDTWTAMQAENRLVKTGHAVQDAVQVQQAQAVNPVTAQQAASMAELVVAQAIPRARTLGVVGTQEDVQGYSNYVRSLAYELADMAASWQGPQNERPSAEDNHRMAAQIGKLNDLAADLKVVLGDDAPAVVARMTQTMEPMSGPFFDYIQERLAAPQEADTTLQDQLVGLLPQQHQAELREGDGANQLLDMVHQIARGRVPQSKRAEVEEAFGRDVLNQMVELVSGGAFDPTANGQASAVDVSRFAEAGDGAIDTVDTVNAVETGEVSARDEFEQRQAARSVGFNAGPSGYNFARTGLQSARTPTQRNPDPFAKTKNKQGVERRPTLFRPNSDDSGVGAEALAKKIDDVRKLHEGASGALDVKAKTLAEVFTDLNYSEQQQLTLFADYLRQEGIATNADSMANTVMGVVNGRVTDPTTIANVRRQMDRFAKARSVVVTEQGTQRMPTEMSHGTLVSMGRGGDRAMSAIRNEAINNLKLKRGSPEYKQYIAKEVSSANLLEFQSAEGQNLMGRTSNDRSITISADRLVKWVRGRDGYEKREGVKAHEAYLEDLLSGIASVMSSGYTNNTLPAMLGPDGAMHSLADGLPPNLRLGLRKVSSFEGDAPTMAELERLRKERVAEVPFERHLTEVDDKGRVVSDDARENRGYQEEVAEEQDKDWFVAEEDTDGQGKDNQTPLDVTKDERYGNAKTEREDLADRSIRKVTDLAGTFGDPDDPQSLISNSGQHAIAETARLREHREAAEATKTANKGGDKTSPSAAEPTHAIAQTAVQRSRGVVTRLDEVGMQKVRDATERAMDMVLDIEHQRNIEPVDVDKLQKIVSWSKDQRDFIQQEMAKVKEGSDRWEELAELNDFDYVIDRGDAYLKQNAAPEVAAAEAPKSSSPQGGGEGHKPNARGTARGPSAMSTVLMDMASGGKSARDMLRFVGQNSRSPFNRQLASALLKAGVTPEIEVRDLAAPEGRKVVHGAYDHRRDRVVLAHSAIQNAEQVFMHEMIHAATVKALNANTPAAQELKAMYRHIKKLGVVTEHYAMQDVKEFIAEAFTSPTFQQLLRDIPAPQASDGTIMGWLGRVVRGILGIPVEHKSAMDALLALGAATMQEDSALRRATNAAMGATAEASKSSSPQRGAQSSGTNGASKYNRQGVNDGRSDVDAGDSGRSQRRIVRLADDRRKSLAQELRSEGNEVYSRPVRFGPGGLGATRQYFLATATDVHSAIVPGQLHALVQRYLASPRYAGRSADVLNFFAIQRATYNRESGEFLTFGPDDASYTGAQVLEKLGLLGVADAPSANRTMYRVEGVKPSETAEFLANHLAYAKNVLGQDKLYVNWERITGANKGSPRKSGGWFNKQGAGKYEGWKSGPTARQGSGVATDAEVQAAKNYLDRVLGDQIKAEFQEITGYSGEWIESENLIRVSTLTTAGIQDVARHEALHAFFSKFIAANPKAVNVLKSLTDDPRVMRRLEALLKDEPAALKQLADGEERLAYIYQFAMAGLLKLPHTPGTTLMHKIRKFLRRVFQMVSDQERAVDLLYAFERGDMRTPNAAARAIAKNLDQGTWMTKGARMMDGVTQRAAAMTLPANVIMSNSASPTARKVGLMMFTNPGEEGAVGAAGKTGYLNDRNQQMRTYDNLFRGVIKDLDKRQMGELIEAMQNEVPADDLRDPDVARAKESLHTLFERFHRYMTDEKGLRMGKIKKDYFPVVWDASKLADDPKAFKGMLLEKYSDVLTDMAAKWEEARQQMLAESSPEVLAFMKKMGLNDKPVTPEFVADTLYDRLTSSEGVDDSAVSTPLRQDGVIRPWAAATEVRSLNFIKPEDRAPFLEKDLVKTLSRYVRQGVRTAEYSSRFGRNGAVLDRHLKTIKKELETASKEMLASGDLKDEKARAKWVERQYRDVANAVGAMEGTLGSDASNTVRKINSWSIVYQNVRLLPLALFSSFVDPLGIVARGGEMREAWTTFMDGMRGVARQWGDMMREEPAQRQKDKWEELAEFAGVIDAATFSHLLSDEYASVYLDGTAKKINEVMFKANGMEAWNRAMRVGATRAAVRFMERHNKNPSEHSRRWMADLGFKVGGLPLDGDGQLIVDKRVMLALHPEMKMDEAETLIGQVHRAINRWVEGAILSPNAAQRPAWGSDPHFSMFWHLKQFAYSFHETIMKRALNEARHGNVMPLGVFAWYIPTMIAADATKGLMLGAGELPGYMKNYDLGDWILHGADRSGVFGIGHVGIDTVQDPTSVAGPMAEQFADFFVEPMEKNIVHALPANSLYSRALV